MTTLHKQVVLINCFYRGSIRAEKHEMSVRDCCI